MNREELYRRFGPLVLEAIVLITKDEINILRTEAENLHTEVENLHTNIKAIAPAFPALTFPVLSLPERTNQQIINAIENKLNNLNKYNWMDN